MIWKNSVERYGAVHKTLHWVIAITVIMMLVMGWQMGSIPNGPDKFWVYSLHKSLGITILALMVMRVIWKLVNWDLPKSLPTHATWEKKLAAFVHWLFYGLLFVQPLSGWMLTGAANSTINWFGFFVVPNIVSPDQDLREAMDTLHGLLPWALTGMIFLHVAGALKHAVIDRDRTLRRMLPFGALLLLLATPAFAADQPTKWRIDRTQSKLTFQALQEGAPFAGRFKAFDGTINFDPKKPEAGNANITIDLGSIDTANGERDGTVKGKDWFFLDNFPTASYTITKFERVGLDTNTYNATGMLRLRGVERPLDMAVTIDVSEKTAHAVGKTTVKRLDFGVGDGQWSDPSMVGTDVTVNIDITAVPLK